MSYKTKYRGTYKTRSGSITTITIQLKNAKALTDDVLPLKLAADPLEIQRGRRGEDEFTAIKSSVANIKLISDIDLEFIEFNQSDYFDYKVIIEKDGILHWQGYIEPDIYREELFELQRVVHITAIDGIGNLKVLPKIEDDIAEHKNIYGQTSLARALWLLLDATGVDATYLSTSWDIYNGSIPLNTGKTRLDMNPLANMYVWFNGEVNIESDGSAYDQLERILTTFNMRVFQLAGKWVIESVSRLATTHFRVNFTAADTGGQTAYTDFAYVSKQLFLKQISFYKQNQISSIPAITRMTTNFETSETFGEDLFYRDDLKGDSFDSDDNLRFWKQVGTKNYTAVTASGTKILSLNKVAFSPTNIKNYIYRDIPLCTERGRTLALGIRFKYFFRSLNTTQIVEGNPRITFILQLGNIETMDDDGFFLDPFVQYAVLSGVSATDLGGGLGILITPRWSIFQPNYDIEVYPEAAKLFRSVHGEEVFNQQVTEISLPPFPLGTTDFGRVDAMRIYMICTDQASSSNLLTGLVYDLEIFDNGDLGLATPELLAKIKPEEQPTRVVINEDRLSSNQLTYTYPLTGGRNQSSLQPLANSLRKNVLAIDRFTVGSDEFHNESTIINNTYDCMLIKENYGDAVFFNEVFSDRIFREKKENKFIINADIRENISLQDFVQLDIKGLKKFYVNSIVENDYNENYEVELIQKIS